MKKILHISSWYPNKWDDLEGIFVKEQYQLFAKVYPSHMVNIQVRRAESVCRYRYIKYSEDVEGYYLLTRIKSQKVIELLTTFLLLWVLCKAKYKKYDVLHFHIAYPLLTYYSWWKKIIKVPILISEHWSAYHFNFNMSWDTHKLDRVKNIFNQQIPLISVSKALLQDIQKFSNTKDFRSTVIPNVIDQKCFYFNNNVVPNDNPIFFAVNNWRKIKNPFPMLEGFATVHSKGIDFKLIIGGYGEELDSMKIYVQDKGYSDKVDFLGKMTKEEIALTLQKSDAYLFSSIYETFSVVAAQALCCGVPLIGSKLAAISEYADKQSYLALEDNNAEQWYENIVFFTTHIEQYNLEDIAKEANIYLSNDSIEKQYFKIIGTWFA